MPVLQRALKQRDTDTKMHAAQIIGNMASLTNHKDLEPYLPQILPGLKQVWGRWSVGRSPLCTKLRCPAHGLPPRFAHVLILVYVRKRVDGKFVYLRAYLAPQAVSS